MKDILLVYWSGTGNTEKMAELVKQGIEEGGKTVDMHRVGDIEAADLDAYNTIVMGCPSMGAEVLEETEMEPFVSEAENKAAGKSVALFGSYGWGNGEWMEDWQDRMGNAGSNMLFEQGLIVNEEPAGEDETECIEYGKKIAGLV